MFILLCFPEAALEHFFGRHSKTCCMSFLDQRNGKKILTMESLHCLDNVRAVQFPSGWGPHAPWTTSESAAHHMNHTRVSQSPLAHVPHGYPYCCTMQSPGLTLHSLCCTLQCPFPWEKGGGAWTPQLLLQLEQLGDQLRGCSLTPHGLHQPTGYQLYSPGLCNQLSTSYNPRAPLLYANQERTIAIRLH